MHIFEHILEVFVVLLNHTILTIIYAQFIFQPVYLYLLKWFNKNIVLLFRKVTRESGSAYEALTLRGLLLYKRQLLPNVILLKKGQRNIGLLQAIMDRVRNGTQTDDDQTKLQYQFQKFPNANVHYGVHYTNDMCTFYNYVELWDECKKSGTYLHACRAAYYTTENNAHVIEALAKVPATAFGYAHDVLCIAEGVQIRLVRNMDVDAGLVNSSVGTVVRVIYDNADVDALLDNKCPPPYCIVAEFADFMGFAVPNSSRRTYPFERQKKWIPLFRERFKMERLAKVIRDQQVIKLLR
jgi:hypothetical protein